MSSTPAIPAVPEIQQEIIDTFELLEDWYARFEYVIDVGKKLPSFPEEQRLDQNKVSGCQSQVWLVSKLENGKLHFYADSDSSLVKGLIALLLAVYNDRTPEEILKYPPDFIQKTGMIQNLSPNRANGLGSMVAHLTKHATEALKKK